MIKRRNSFGIRKDVLKENYNDVLEMNNEKYLIDTFQLQNFSLNSKLISIGNDKEKHVVIAYDYDYDNDEIYCHFGYENTYTHVTIESQGFNSYETTLTIDFNNSHNHSNNYVVESISNGISKF